MGTLKRPFLQSLLTLAFLPHQAQLMLDAIVRTLVRVLITRKNLLEWVTAADMELALKNDMASYWKRMWLCPAAGAVLLLLSMFKVPEAIIAVLPVVLLLIAAPATASWVSEPQAE